MANEPFIYRRTDANPTSNPTFADPANLPSNQKLIFEGAGQDVADSFKFLGKNAIGGGTLPQDDGSSVTGHEHLGRRFGKLQVEGYIRDPVEELKLLAFFNTKQQVGVHIKGIFGLKVPLHPAYDIDPTPTVGLMFDDIETNTKNENASVAFFKTTLLIDGTLVKTLPT